MENENIQISFVIPAYNVSLYIEKCLDSCVNQGLNPETYELVVIDDGSTDNTLDVLHQYKIEHKEYNLIIISQENRGLSVARNTGMLRASGKYIWFVDSDDCVCSHVLADMLTQMSSEKLDMLWCNHTLIDEKGSGMPLPSEDDKTSVPQCVYSGSQFILKCFNHSCMVWMFLFRKEFLCRHGLRFKEGIYLEDILFTVQAIYYCERIKYLNLVVYEYLIRGNSTMRDSAKIAKRAKDSFRVASELSKFCREIVVEKQVQEWIWGFMNVLVQYNLRRLVKQKLLNDFNSGILFLRENEVYPLKYAKSFKANMLTWLLNNNIAIYRRVVSILS